MQLANKKGWLRIGDLALYFYCNVVWRSNIIERSCFWSVHFHIGSTFQRVRWPVLFSSRVTVWDQNYSDMSGIYRRHDREVHELLNFFYSSLFSVRHASTWVDQDNLHLSFALLSVSGDIVKRFFGRTDAPMVRWRRCVARSFNNNDCPNFACSVAGSVWYLKLWCRSSATQVVHFAHKNVVWRPHSVRWADLLTWDIFVVPGVAMRVSLSCIKLCVDSKCTVTTHYHVRFQRQEIYEVRAFSLCYTCFSL